MKTNTTNIIVTISLYLFLGFATLGCSDDFLVNEPIMQNVQTTYYSNDDQMFNALMATYDIMQWQCGGPMSNPIPFSEIRSDNARTGGGSEGDQPDMQKIEDYTNESVNSYSDAIFKRDYKCIYRANLVINAEYDSDITKVYKAEALFLRAWNYFDLLRTYGPCPITLDAVHPSDYKSSRSTRLEMNQQIEKDLLAAIPLLPKSYPDAMVGRIMMIQLYLIKLQNYLKQ